MRPTHSAPVKLALKRSGQGFPLLCLHGHPGSGDCLSGLTASLSQQFQTLTPDLRGYGGSQVKKPFTMADHLQDLEALLDHHHIQTYGLVGWSLGGILALELALRHPQRVRSLVLLATAAHPRSNLPQPTGRDYFNTALAALINQANPGWDWNINRLGRHSLFRDLLYQHTPTAYGFLAKYAIPAYWKTSRHAHQAFNQALHQGYNRVEALSQISCPALVLAGSHDRHILPEASHETARALPQGDWICYPEAAHLFPWEIPDQVNADIQRWLTTHLGLFSS
ncbi:alpha/beta fold hydrolase [Synechococcales cyanobacterium C]|uniref:Alpha/beta fold hydrolase n=1 Tax=Petrachloros mirabilis ULC683 TaxID=2781853 RepID=A0A8K1ZZT3_9CYAN|nr:alpha/beta hydrolase [Petrachloros mirabilis]NCJ06998.1 alpha/beta fold hydrolase [Petrachloros mirabilis ULC683]